MEKCNDHRADHKVITSDFGSVVQWDYEGYTISLAMDGANTVVWRDDGPFLFETYGTGPDSIVKAVAFINGTDKSWRYENKEEVNIINRELADLKNVVELMSEGPLRNLVSSCRGRISRAMNRIQEHNE